MAESKRDHVLLRRQPAMRRVLLASLPCIGGAVYYFGWRALAVVIVSCAAAFLAEYVFCRQRHEPVSEAAFVTAVLFALVMPPTVPWHVVVIGVGFLPLLFAPLVPYQTVGFFIAAILLTAGAATLLILPSLITILEPYVFPKTKPYCVTCDHITCTVSAVALVALLAVVAYARNRDNEKEGHSHEDKRH